jgi:GT2 family glycosyltransferase
VRFVPFTAALLRRELFARVGFLDEDFESYLEDVEFGLRCALGGFSGVYVPDAIAYHAGSATLGAWHRDTVRRIARNQLLLVAKHYPEKWIRRYGWPVVAAQALWGAVALRHGAGLAWLRGKLEGLRAFRAMRHAAPDPGRLAEILEQSERELLELQQRTGFDLYWRLYFALT